MLSWFQSTDLSLPSSIIVPFSQSTSPLVLVGEVGLVGAVEGGVQGLDSLGIAAAFDYNNNSRLTDSTKEFNKTAENVHDRGPNSSFLRRVSLGGHPVKGTSKPPG